MNTHWQRGHTNRRHATVASIVAAAALTAGAAIAADQAQTSQHSEHQSGSMSDMGKMSQGSQKMHQAMMTGMQDMKMTGDTDRDFAEMMIHHHEQAIAMSRAQLEDGKSSELRTRAQKIIDDSQKDIAVLKQWRDQQGGAKSP